MSATSHTVGGASVVVPLTHEDHMILSGRLRYMRRGRLCFATFPAQLPRNVRATYAVANPGALIEADRRDAEIMAGPRNAFHGFTMRELGERHIFNTFIA